MTSNSSLRSNYPALAIRSIGWRSNVLAVVFQLLISCLGNAQSVRNYAGEFLELGVGARQLALGGAGAAISEDATAGYWNPAGLGTLDFPMVTAMHETRFDGTVNYNYGALAVPLDAHTTAALSILHIGVSNILDTRNALVNADNTGQLDASNYLDYNKVSSFGNYDWVAIFSIAQSQRGSLFYSDPGGEPLFPHPPSNFRHFGWGVNAKLIYRRLDPQTTAMGIGFDVAARYQVTRALTVAAVAQDITTTLLSYSTGTKELVSPTLKLGGTYLWNITSDGAHKLFPTLDADLRFEGRGSVAQLHAGPISVDLHEGLEYQFKNIFALRAGYNDMQMWSVGVGLAFSRLHIDYAYLGFNGQDQLGATHRISLSFLLEQPRWKRKGE